MRARSYGIDLARLMQLGLCRPVTSPGKCRVDKTNKGDLQMDKYKQIEELMDLLKGLPDESELELDPEKCTELVRKADRAFKLFAGEGGGCGNRIEFVKQFNMAAVQIEGDSLSISDAEEFKSIISDAACFEIYPLSNGTIRLEITFKDILREA